MGTQERLLLQSKRLHWSRFLFLLGVLIIVSTYQYLRLPQSLPSLWAAVSSQHPVKLSSRDTPSMIAVTSDPLKASFEMESETQVTQATKDRDEAIPGRTMENIPSTPRKTANISPIPKNKSSPTEASPERVKANTPITASGILNHYTPVPARQTIKNYTPKTPRREMKSYHRAQYGEKMKKYTPSPLGGAVDSDAPFTLMTVIRSHGLNPRKAVKDSEIMTTYKMLETNPSQSMVEKTTPTKLKKIIANTPTFPINDVETNTLVEKNTLTTPRRVDKNSTTKPQGLVGDSNLTVPQGAAVGHIPDASEGQEITSTMADSGQVETKASAAAWRGRDPSFRSSAPTIVLYSATFWGLTKKLSTAPSTSATPRNRADPVTQVHHYVTVPTAPSPSWTTAMIPEVLSPSPSVLPSRWPDFHPQGEYPPDLFSVEERQQGWLVLHIFGMMYVFVALAIVCDEYFVPALGVITEKLQISEDVAGATFMAAGGSAPELFTSLIGVFISHSNVGIGTIVGSAVFNILFVIGTCSLFSREILHLTWWPLFRDVSFYILDLMMLIMFFLDSLITWWESLLLLLAYAFYVFTMKWNKQLEVWVKENLSKGPVTKVMAVGDLSKLPSVLTRGSSSTSLHNSTIRSTIFWLMLHSLDPLGKEEEPANLPAVTVTVTPAPAPDVKGDQDEDPGSQEGHVARTAMTSDTSKGENGGQNGSEAQLEGEGEIDAEGKGDNENEDDIKGDEDETKKQEFTTKNQGETKSDEKGTDDEEGGDSEDEEDVEDEEEEEEEENEEPLSLEWPETRQKQAIYLFLLPIVLPLWLTVPDVRRLVSFLTVLSRESRKFFVLTFLGSIMWIAMFSYLMVWWAHQALIFHLLLLWFLITVTIYQVGETMGISEEIMGLTILAAGTSIPDLITSVIVARKGLGDMAVSSSVGSNIFDITVGLPVPWLLFSLINGLQPVPVSSNGLFCAIVLLFLMLLFVISSIASCKWRMNKILGFTMFLLYFVFLIISVMLEDRIISCPVSV
ncbi:Sodium/potassium/calcium exchanger 1 [Galemys pyrenaicus]|uniref:Sodium/potassium/calcium exchanger 1 n=1 Tax=Galemys pyrenaicus TaxID=202257 RepID=A0A8J5ZS57_GALPY|nr:Sodium/potassium/calcium exchanger 1 [Galemys pyrenaicus]